MKHNLRLTIRPERYAIVQLEAGASRPVWVPREGLVSLTQAEDETSIICPEGVVPSGTAPVSDGWRALKVEGPFDLQEVGVLAGIAEPLAKAGISIFALGTYNTDYLLVRDEKLEKAVTVLEEAGHRITRS
jgi:hypothetical protein